MLFFTVDCLGTWRLSLKEVPLIGEDYILVESIYRAKLLLFVNYLNQEFLSIKSEVGDLIKFAIKVHGDLLLEKKINRLFRRA